MLLGSADSWSPLNPPRTGYHQGYPKAVDPTRQGSRGNILIRNTTPSEQALMECSACAEEVSPPHTGWSNRCEATGTVPRRGKSIAYCENRRSDEREKPVLDCVYQTVHQQMFILSRTFAQHGLCAVRGRFDFSSHRHFCWVSNLGEDEKQGIICAVCAAAVHRESMAYVLSESVRQTCFATSGVGDSPKQPPLIWHVICGDLI